MKLLCRVLFSVTGMLSVTGTSNLLENVNTLIGTSYFENQFDVHDYGNTAPFAGPPFSHTPWTAQTRDSEDKCQSPYYYFDTYWQGMRRSHWMSGSCTIDYGSATIIPSLTLNLKEALRYHTMNHSTEISTPASYKIDLLESSLLVEAASDIRSGIMKVTPRTTIQHKYFYLIFKSSDTMYNESFINISYQKGGRTSNIPKSHYMKNGEEIPHGDEKEKLLSLTISSPVHRWYQSKQKNADFSGHHYFISSRPACEFGIIEEYTNIKKNQLIGISNKKGTVAAYLKFESALGEVSIATGTSFVSVEKAEENLYSELDITLSRNGEINTSRIEAINLDVAQDKIPENESKSKSKLCETISCVENSDDVHNNNSKILKNSKNSIFDIDRLIDKVTKIWEDKLRVINATPYLDNNYLAKDTKDEIQSGNTRYGGQVISNSSSKNQLITFYSSLWHTQLLPRIISDYDGEYLSFSEKTRVVETTSSEIGFNNYFDDFSMWDIFRAQMPLLSLIYTENISDMIISLIKKAEQGDWLPIFPAWNSYTDEMIGDHCSVFIADCYFKSLLSSNHNTKNNLLVNVYKYLIKNALLIPSDEDYKKGKGRRALKSYMKYGFIPLEDEILNSAHINQQVSRTLEYAYDDYVLSQFAQLYSNSIREEIIKIRASDPAGVIRKNNERLKNITIALDDAEKTSKILLKRSQNYRWVIDGNTDNIWYKNQLNSNAPVVANITIDDHPTNHNIEKELILEMDGNSDSVTDKKMGINGIEKSVGFIRGRFANLSWTETSDSFDPSKYYSWLTETNVWQYTFSVLHDVEGMIEIYGGPEKFVKKLDEFFDNSWYNHGNEPDHHVLYLYAYVKGSAWKIQDKLRDIISSQYGPLERSMSGNDDAGQMSAWLVLSSIGFYQVCPGCGGRSEYVLGIPLFSKIEINLPLLSKSVIISDDCDSPSGDGSCNAFDKKFNGHDNNNNNNNDNNDNNKKAAIVRSTLLIETVRLNNSEADKYIQSVTWNGCLYDCAFFPHSLLANGGHLIAYLGPVPNKMWGGDGRKCMNVYQYPGDISNHNIDVDHVTADSNRHGKEEDKIAIC